MGIKAEVVFRFLVFRVIWFLNGESVDGQIDFDESCATP